MTTMKRTNPATGQPTVHAGEIVARQYLSNLLGISHGGARDLYNSLGYPKELSFHDYAARYGRQDMAYGIIYRPAAATWAGNVLISEASEKEETELEKAWAAMLNDEKLAVKSKMARMDRLTSLGRFGVLFLGFNDISSVEGLAEPIKQGTTLKLLYLKPLSEATAKVTEYETNPSDERFSLPKIYSVDLKNESGAGIGTASLRVHHSRVIHVAWDLLENESTGMPVLEPIFNRLMDLEKIVGGSAEMFWRGARPGFGAAVDKEFTMGPEEEAKLQQNISEYENNLRRILLTKGISLNALQSQVSDPTPHVSAQVDMISAKTGIPKRILLGSERGELSSGQDADAWSAYIQARREEIVEPRLLRPFINKMIELKILPEPVEPTYVLQWPNMYSVSDKDKAEVGRTRATALKEYSSNPVAQNIVSPAAFLEFFLGLDANQIELIAEMSAEAVVQMQKGEATPEEEQIMKEEN